MGRGRGPSLSVPQSFSRAQVPPPFSVLLSNSYKPGGHGPLAPPVHTPLVYSIPSATLRFVPSKTEHIKMSAMQSSWVERGAFPWWVEGGKFCLRFFYWVRVLPMRLATVSTQVPSRLMRFAFYSVFFVRLSVNKSINRANKRSTQSIVNNTMYKAINQSINRPTWASHSTIYLHCKMFDRPSHHRYRSHVHWDLIHCRAGYDGCETG